MLILALASGFRLTPPPRALDAVPAEVYVHLHGPTVMADVLLTPGRAGANAVEIASVRRRRAPRSAGGADQLRRSGPGVEPLRLDAVRDDAVWRAGPVQLPHGGEWTVRLDVLVSDFAKAALEATVPVADR